MKEQEIEALLDDIRLAPRLLALVRLEAALEDAQNAAQQNNSTPVGTDTDQAAAILRLQNEVDELKRRLDRQEAFTKPIGDAKIAGQQAVDLLSKGIKIASDTKKKGYW